MLEGRAMLRSKSALFPALHKGGGIEAALVQYDGTNTNQRKEHHSVARSSFLDNYVVNSEVNLAVSPLGIPGMPYSLDRRSDGLRPSVMRLIAPDAVPRGAAGDGPIFPPLDKRNSFNPKTSGQSINRLGVRRYSQMDKKISAENAGKKIDHSTPAALQLSKQQTMAGGDNGGSRHHSQSPQRVKSKKHPNRKHRHHHSHRHRRKPWVLNPFRQDDEDAVRKLSYPSSNSTSLFLLPIFLSKLTFCQFNSCEVAKRTHNRRRWSHVFPLGEDEFKRHAGPNWKSLCQPAIRKYQINILYCHKVIPLSKLTNTNIPCPQSAHDDRLPSCTERS